ncbi:integrase [Bacillus anthracis]|nr:integrase [Bacillus anthracis]
MEKEKNIDITEEFSSFLLKKGRKASTIKRYIYDVKHFIYWLEKSNKTSYQVNDLLTVHPNEFEDYFNSLRLNLHYSDKTIYRIYSVLNQFYQHLDIYNPLENINITQPDRSLRAEDFISDEEETKLKDTLYSLNGLTKRQHSVRPMLMDRNASIINLLLNYGLSLQELVSLQMKHIHFENNTLSVPEVGSIKRTIQLTEEDKDKLYKYHKNIPTPVRPKYHSCNPLFIAFDFIRGTYRWSYENDAPKGLTEISIQKMIKLEVARSELRKGISAKHLRNTFIIRLIENNTPEDTIMKQMGFKSKLSLKRYSQYVENKNKHQ